MILQISYTIYRLLWIFLLPLTISYLWFRSLTDTDYRTNIGERLGFYKKSVRKKSIWVHAVSLGEARSAYALIQSILEQGDFVVLTHFTPTAMRSSVERFRSEIDEGILEVVWVPFDIRWSYKRFFSTFQPKIGLTLEVEIWPSMVMTAKSVDIPLFLCNAQYATRSYLRDSKGLRFRQRYIPQFTGALVKSKAQAERFSLAGQTNLAITGELRFDQPIPKNQAQASIEFKKAIPTEQEVITIASGVEGEEDIYIELIKRLSEGNKSNKRKGPLVIYVPRAPERFDIVLEKLKDSGLSAIPRSELFSKDLSANRKKNIPDVIVGDSIGEMFFYIGLSDRVIVGGGFIPRGAHNVIEALLMEKPVLTGPFVWTIEFPFVEAEAAGIAKSFHTPDSLYAELLRSQVCNKDKITEFLHTHRGATRKTLGQVNAFIKHKKIL